PAASEWAPPCAASSVSCRPERKLLRPSTGSARCACPSSPKRHRRAQAARVCRQSKRTGTSLLGKALYRFGVGAAQGARSAGETYHIDWRAREHVPRRNAPPRALRKIGRASCRERV